MSTPTSAERRTGALYATGAFVAWGLFPLYFHFIKHVPPLEVVLQRSVWSLLFVLLILAWRGQWAWLRVSLSKGRQWLLFACTGSLVMCNWFVYVYAVQSDQVVEASLGYFINPLVSVLLGVLVLKERLQPVQKAAVALALAGVVWLTVAAGRLPWVALVLACSFGLYGLLRKTAPLGALEGLALESLLLAPLTVPALLWLQAYGGGVLVQGPASLVGLLLLAGPLTALPLLMFSAGARRLPLSTIGMLQYLSPTLQLLLAVFVFGEPFDLQRLVGFVLIWLALALVSVSALGLGPWSTRPVPLPPA